MSWFVYLLSCADGTLYTGIARDPEARLAAHNRGSGAAYTRSRLPARLEWIEPASDRSTALRRELQVKALPRSRKLELIESRGQLKPDAPLLTLARFGAPHGFSTREGGSSEGAYRSLNLGSSTDDEPQRISRNRDLFASWFDHPMDRLCLLDQVHGDRVVMAEPNRSVEADAQISADPSLLLVVGSADCLPILFHDPVVGAVAAAHCGWRGTVAGLAAKVVKVMAETFGSAPERLRVAMGPAICGACYQVGGEVMERFRQAGFPPEVVRPDEEGRWLLDLVGANVIALERAGVRRDSIILSGACTACEPALYYSHRRDRGVTGRHWAGVRATAPSSAVGT